MKRIKNSIKNFIVQKKALSAVIAVLVLGIGYYTYAKVFPSTAATTYISATVKRGKIVSTITGTGQVTASSQIDIKSKVSGDLVYLNTKANGTEVTKGTLIAQVDTRDAELSLENAQISYQKLVEPADASTLLQAQNSLSDAASANEKSYEDALNVISSTFSDIPGILTGMENLLFGQAAFLQVDIIRPVSQTAVDYQGKAALSFYKAKTNYANIFAQYQKLSRTSSHADIEAFTASTYLLAKDLSDAVKNTQNTLDYVRRQKNDSTGATEANNVSLWTTTINSDLASLLSAENSISSSGQALSQKNVDLTKLQNGPTALDLAAQKVSLQQQENSYADYFIKAPFDGILARLSVKPTDSVSAGTIIGTLVSSQKMTTITLNEVDVEKVHVGQKAKLTFDAIDGLTIDGTVTTVDLVGTVTQGVVNYNVEISLDTQDSRINSGMSVSATIITDTKEDILVVPNSAVKTQGNFTYVELLPKPPTQKKVQIGISNDTLTEIVSGVAEGDQVVTRTITATGATVAKTATPSLFGNAGVRTGTGTGGNRTGGNFPRN